MGRNNADFEEQALYHGTHHPFEVGDVIAPSKISRGYGDHFAYATPLKRIAEANAKKRSDSGTVYTVEPLDKDEAKWSEDKAVVTSRHGFRVIGKGE